MSREFERRTRCITTVLLEKILVALPVATRQHVQERKLSSKLEKPTNQRQLLKLKFFSKLWLWIGPHVWEHGLQPNVIEKKCLQSWNKIKQKRISNLSLKCFKSLWKSRKHLSKQTIGLTRILTKDREWSSKGKRLEGI